MAAVPLDRPDGVFEVPGVVQSIENPEDVDAVIDRQGDEPVEEVIGIVLVSEDILPSQQHLKGRVLCTRFDKTQTFPRILAKKPEAHIKCRTSPHLQ